MLEPLPLPLKTWALLMGPNGLLLLPVAVAVDGCEGGVESAAASA